MERRRDEVLDLHPRRDPLPPDPHAVRGGPGQLLPDRGRPADAGRHRARTPARRSTRSRRRWPSTGAGSRTSSGSSSPTSTSTTSGWSASSPTARGAEVAALDLLAPVLEEFGAHAERDDELAEALMLRHGIPRDVVHRAARRLPVLPRLGRQRARRPPAARRRDARVRGPRLPGPAPPRPLAVGHAVLGRAARAADRRRPPDQAHLVQPADLAAARRALRRAGRRPAARADDVHGLAARDARAARRGRAGRARRAGHRARRPDRRALRACTSGAPPRSAA